MHGGQYLRITIHTVFCGRQTYLECRLSNAQHSRCEGELEFLCKGWHHGCLEE